MAETTNTGVINVRDYGATGNGITDDYLAIRRAIAAAGAVQLQNQDPRLVTAVVYFPAGRYRIGANQHSNARTLTLPRGTQLVGDSLSSTAIIHDGGTGTPAPLLRSDLSSSNNTGTQIRNLYLRGDGTQTTYGIHFYNAFRDSEVNNVEITNCETNIYLERSWSSRLISVNSSFPAKYCLYAKHWVVGYARSCRFDDAGVHGVFLEGDAVAPNTNITFQNCAFQKAQQNGAYGVDVSDVHFSDCWFEQNNKSNGGHCDVYMTTGALNRGGFFTFTHCYGTDVGYTGTTFIRIDKAARVTIQDCHNNASGNYVYGFRPGDDVYTVLISQSRLYGSTAKLGTGTNVQYIQLGDQSGTGGVEMTKLALDELAPLSGDAVTLDSGTNVHLITNAAANRRCEHQFSSAGTPDWYVGRGDSDEAWPGDYYVARIAGANPTADLRVEKLNGDVHVTTYLTIGGYYLWADSSGRLRINSSRPTDPDADGTIVGTQT